MEELEQKALTESTIKPSYYKRYVDDTFVVWPEHIQSVETFLNTLNAQSPDIQFTMEKESNGKLAFLDVIVERTHNKLSTAVYRKPTDSGRYLNFNSNLPEATRRGILNTLLRRAETHCKVEETKQIEIKNVKSTLKNNGYPERIFRPKKKKNKPKETEKPRATMVIPYVKNIAEKIRRQAHKFNVRTVFSSPDTIGRRLTRVKPPRTPLDTKNCIYSLTCGCGEKYIGETRRALKCRIGEHEKKKKRKKTQLWQNIF